MQGSSRRISVIFLIAIVALFITVMFYDEDEVVINEEADVEISDAEGVEPVEEVQSSDSLSKEENVESSESDAQADTSDSSVESSEQVESSGDQEESDEVIEKDNSVVADTEGYIHGKILPHKGFEEALLALPGVSLANAMEVSNALRFSVDFRFLRAGEDFKVKIDKDGRVEEFLYYPDIITFHILKRDPKSGELVYSSKILPTDPQYRIVEGAIETSLNQALIERDDVTGTIRAATNNVLGCMISFRTDARKGDKYRILLEDRYYKGEMVPGSKILYVSYEGKRAGFHEAYRYEDEDPKSAFNAHYTKDGKALIANALRLPVDRVHVTSAFGYRRHPVTGRRAFHNGVDYGGPVGSPIYAVAEGRVIEVSTCKYGGKQIILRHADNTKTYYLHLHKFLVKQGQHVRPRQQIAQMGRTGRVTGPHLHFGIKAPNGKWVNPLKKRMIATPQLAGKQLERYKTQIKEIKGLLSDTEAHMEWLKRYDQGPQPGDFYEKYDSI
jgi:murein DD-endopeptidase MepM/ murein hydrolase activator NlpD